MRLHNLFESNDPEDRPITQGDLNKLENTLDQYFINQRSASNKTPIDINFSYHFLQRVNDERNKKQISIKELINLFAKEYKQWSDDIAQLGANSMKSDTTDDAYGNMRDHSSDINILFGLTWDRHNNEWDLSPITTMRKKNWRHDHKDFPVETVQNKKFTLNESGSLPGVGAIHVDEIQPTLAALEKVLGVDLMNNALGSVGKKRFSGDIDVALDIPTEDIPEFVEKLKTIPEIMDVAKSSVIMTKVQIQNYDEDKQMAGKERTGYVQVDFMPGDPDWMKTYYHSPHEEGMADDGRFSKYKGAHRTILLAIVAAVHSKEHRGEMIDDERYEESDQFMFSPRDGLVRITRRPVPKKSGMGYTKKNENEIIAGPWRTADEIADVLDLGDGEALYSFESLVDAIEANYPEEEKAKIFTGFADNKKMQDMGIPDEIKDYLQ